MAINDVSEFITKVFLCWDASTCFDNATAEF